MSHGNTVGAFRLDTDFVLRSWQGKTGLISDQTNVAIFLFTFSADI